MILVANLCGNLQDAISRRVKDTRAIQSCIPWPAKDSPALVSYKPSAEDKAKLSAEEQEKKKKLKDDENKTDIIDYITRVFINSQDKKMICAPYCFT